MAPRPVRTRRAANVEKTTVSKEMTSKEATGDQVIKKEDLESIITKKSTKPPKGKKQSNKEYQESIICNDDLKDKKQTKKKTNIESLKVSLKENDNNDDDHSSLKDDLSVAKSKIEEINYEVKEKEMAIQEKKTSQKKGRKGLNKKDDIKISATETEDKENGENDILENKNEVDTQVGKLAIKEKKTLPKKGRKGQNKKDGIKLLTVETEEKEKGRDDILEKKNEVNLQVAELAVKDEKITSTKGRKGQNKKDDIKVPPTATEEKKHFEDNVLEKKDEDDLQEVKPKYSQKLEVDLQDENPEYSQKLAIGRKRNVKINVSDEDLNVKSKKNKSVTEEKKSNKEKLKSTNVGVKSVTNKVPVEEKTIIIDEPKVTKRNGRGKIENENTEEALELTKIPESKLKQAAKGKRGVPKKTLNIDESGRDSSKDEQEPPTKKTKSEDKKPLKNKSVTSYESIDFSNSSKNSEGKPWNLKISSWNVDGIRAWLSKGGLDYIKYEKPDILCLQEVKCSQDKLPKEVVSVPGYHPYWLCSEKDGYAGVGIYTTKMAINVQYGLQDEELDSEGRIITAEYEQFYLICTYVPNAGRQLVTLPKKLKWNEIFHKYVKDLDAKKPVIICGDMNVAHNEIDLTNPKTNKKNAGFTPEERAGMTEILKDGFVDTFRHLNPDRTGAYTFWTYMMNSRAKNVGWRLDYLIISERLLPSLCDSVIRSEVYGSDHCPLSLFLHLTSVPKIPSE